MVRAGVQAQAIEDDRTRPASVPLPEGCVWLSDGMTPLSARQVGLVPGAEAPLLEIALPARLRGHAREQVGFRQLRDALGDRRLELRPFEAGVPKGQWQRALAADPAAAEDWRRIAGPGGRAVLPDYLALPASPGLWVLASEGAGLRARLGPGDGFSAPLAVGLRQLRAALEAGAPKAVLLMGDAPAGLAEVFAEREIPVLREATGLANLGIAPPKLFGFGELDADLRRDPGAARSALARRVLPWRWPLLAGLVAVALWSGAEMLATGGLEMRERAVRADTLARLRDSFVPTGPVLDVRLQVSRALAEARAAAESGVAETSPLDLIEPASAVMHDRGAAPQSLAYTPAEGLAVTVQVADFAAAEALAGALRDAGLTVRLVEASAGSGTGSGAEGGAGVRAELRLTAGPEGG